MSKSRLLFSLVAVVAGLVALPSMASALNFQATDGATASQVGSINTLATGDFNEDGKTDLVTASNSSGSYATPGLRIMLSAGDGTFTDGGTLDGSWASGPYNVYTGDFNGDGHVDLLYARQAASQYTTYLGTGTGTFNASGGFSFSSGDYGSRTSMGIGDLNGDGKDDIVFGEKNGDYKVGFWNGSGFNITDGSVGGGVDCYSVAIGDFNGDGNNDVALGMGSTDGNGNPIAGAGGYVDILLGNGTGALSMTGAGNPHAQAAPLGVTTSLAVGDFNGDGIDDLAASSLNLEQSDGYKYESTVQYWLGSSSSVLGAPTVLQDTTVPPDHPVNPTRELVSNVQAGDFNGDGDQDLAYLDGVHPNGPSFNEAKVFLGNDDGTFSEAGGSPYNFNHDSELSSLGLGDFGGNGGTGLVAGASGGGACSGCGAPELNSLPDVSTDVDSISFDKHLVGSSTTRNVTIVNNGGPKVTVTDLTLGGPDSDQYEITAASNACKTGLSSGQSCQIGVEFNPTSTGVKTGQLDFTLANGVSLTPLGLFGEGTQPEASFDPSGVIDFGQVARGSTSPATTVTVTSSGTAPLIISDVSKGAGDSGWFDIVNGSDTCSNTTLAIGDSCEFKVVFDPPTNLNLGHKYLQIGVSSNDPDPDDQYLNVTGEATDPGISVSPSPYVFADAVVGGTGQGKTFTVTSNGTTDLNVGAIAFTGADASDFSVESNDCTHPVPSGSACTFVAIFHPGTANHALRQATMQVDSDAAASPTSTGVSGTALVASGSVSPGTYDFGDVKVGQTAPTKTFTFRATGTAPIAIDDAGLNGPDHADFALVSNTCDQTTIPAGGTCQVVLNFTPSVRGVRHLEMKFTTDAGNFYDEITGNGVSPAGSLAPASQDFGSVTVGSSGAAKTITVKSTGADPLKVTSASVSGTDASSFKLANAAACNGTQASSCGLSVTFSPTGSAGARSATLSVITNAGTLTSALTGTAAAKPVPPAPKAELRLKAPGKVKRGKKLVVTSKVKGLSGGAIAGIVIAAKVSGPAKAPKSVKISSLGQGKTKTVKLKIPVKKSAKPGKKITVTVTAKASGKKLATAKVKSKVKK